MTLEAVKFSLMGRPFEPFEVVTSDVGSTGSLTMSWRGWRLGKRRCSTGLCTRVSLSPCPW